MMDFVHPRKISSPKSDASSSSAKSFDDEPYMVAAASDASTASTSFNDEPLMVALPCYKFLNERAPEDFDHGSVSAWGAPGSSDDDRPLEDDHVKDPALAQYLKNENLRLEEENALLRTQYASFLQMASQGLLGYPTVMPMAGFQQPGYAHPGWPQQTPWVANGQSDCMPQMHQRSQPRRQQKHVAFAANVDVDAEADFEFDEDCSSELGAAHPSSHTSVMLRNLPNSYTRALLIKLLDEEGFAGKYDFVYLPIDFKTRLSLAYAFINLIDAKEAKRFWKHFHGFSNWAVPSHKIASVDWSEFQGLARHIERYRSSPVMHEGVPDEYKPVLLTTSSTGTHRIPFPVPTEKVRAPRCRLRSKAMKPGRVA